MSKEKRNVVITGFGPFGVHSVNNSWECAKLIKTTDFEEKQNINLVIQEIPVIYEAANEVVPKLWQEYDPILVVHIGVHAGDTIIIEKRAHNYGYVKIDVQDCTPQDGKCPLGSEKVVYTQFDVDNILSEEVSCSSDAGRFLCEYTYYLSLSKDSSRTLFIHVPPCESCVSKQTIVKHISNIIKKCLNQLRNDKK